MGNICCAQKEEITKTHIEVESIVEEEADRDKKDNIKKKTFNFDVKNFIHMKTQSLFNEYEIKDKLGEGAYGCVYKVQHKTTQFFRAVKAIKRKHVDSTAFSNEIAILKTVDHPHIIKLFECYYDSNYYYMVEEYCSAGDLYDYIRKQKQFSENKAAKIMLQLLSSINYLHQKKIVHRDLKPENIVFIHTEEGNDLFIKLIDFGTSVLLKNGNLSQELGTIYYIAPEVFKNNYNEKADVWSCGIILYTMLCGHPPFLGNKEEDIKNKILNSKLQFLPKDFNKVSAESIEFVKQLLTNNPQMRISAAEALENSWLNKMGRPTSEESVLEGSVLTNLSKFATAVTLQKATLSFIANQISINEEIKKLKDEFDKIDINKDGLISRDELINCLALLHPYQEAVIKSNEIFHEIDFNNDGNINFSEFITVNMKKEKLLSDDMLKKAFKLFDIDGNGFITIEELKQTIPLEIQTNSQWIEIVKEVDQDGDCQISYGEFKKMMEKLTQM